MQVARPWLTLHSPNLWQAQGPHSPCDTLLPKLNPPLFSLVRDVIALAIATPHRTPILFSFPAIKHYVHSRRRGGGSSSSQKCARRVLRSTRAFISAVPRRGRNDQSLCAAGIAQFTAPPKCPCPSLCMALSLSLFTPIIWPGVKNAIAVLYQWFAK